IGNVPVSGDQTVTPKQTTTYELLAKGPGGEVERSATIGVNAQPTATIAFSQPEVTYRKIGDKVVEQDAATLTWSTADGSTVTITPLGSVAADGSMSIEATPTQASTGPVNQDVAYTLHVANACGGTTTKTATLHIVGSIEPPPPVTLASIFYPTKYPERRHSSVGLLPSQERELAKAAQTFMNNDKYDTQNMLMVVGHADVRGSAKFNLGLSERRAQLVKKYLVSQGVPADKIEIRADGKKDQLTEVQVMGIQSRDPQSPQKWMMDHKKATWLAYNRRVDIVLEPAGDASAEAYPNDAPAARILWERPTPSLHAVESASKTHSSETAQMRNSGSGN
ncbi:MAG: OmpA family protein, partial [Candidatus Acidiferrales bacterium]